MYNQKESVAKIVRERTYLDLADTIFAANFVISYYDKHSDAPSLMRSQKIEDLKLKGLWDKSTTEEVKSISIPTDPTNWGFNIFVTSSGANNKNNRPSYLDQLDLTSSHINNAGWSFLDFIICLDLDNKGIRFHQCLPPDDLPTLGYIRLDNGVLNNKPICDEIGIPKFTAPTINKFLLNGKVIVPTSPFGNLMRGGKLLALIASSNNIREIFSNKYGHDSKCLFYVTSLYGTSKDQSQYSQLDRYLRFIGNTTSKNFPLRIKPPHSNRLLDFFHNRGFYRHNFVPQTGSSKADRTNREILSFIRDCLRHHTKNDVVKEVRKKYKSVCNEWDNGLTEQKSTYISNYGFSNWKEVIRGEDKVLKSSYESMEPYDIENLIDYWKKKISKGDWGARKILRETKSFDSKPILLNDLLRDKDFVQVR